jgi:hypothetical protein
LGVLGPSFAKTEDEIKKKKLRLRTFSTPKKERGDETGFLA